MLKPSFINGRKRGQRGFTMIEVLVTLVIMMFGMLGIAGLIVRGQKASSEAYQRNQALVLASDMAERIRSNRKNAASYIGTARGTPLGVAPITVPTACTTGSCTSSVDVVDFDIVTWNNLLIGTQETSGASNIGGILNARGCIEVGAGAPIRVSVAWQGTLNTGTAPVTTCFNATAAATYGGVGYMHVVSIDVL